MLANMVKYPAKLRLMPMRKMIMRHRAAPMYAPVTQPLIAADIKMQSPLISGGAPKILARRAKEQGVFMAVKAQSSAMQSNAAYAERARKLNRTSKFAVNRVQVARKRLAMHRAIRNLEPAHDPSRDCRVVTPIAGNVRSQLKYLDDLHICAGQSRDQQIRDLQNSINIGGLSFAFKPGQAFVLQSSDGILKNENCLCYALILHSADAIVAKHNQFVRWREREIDRRGLQRYYN